METKQIMGIILIMVVIALYLYWLRYARKQKGVAAKEEKDAQVFEIIVKGVYSPSVIRAKAGKLVRINFKREENTECSRFVSFPDFRIRKELPEGKAVTVEFTPEKKGEYGFTCDMGMYQGRLIVE